MIRTADAAGYTESLSDKSADIYNQKTLRSMQGSHFHLPIYRGPILDMVGRLAKARGTRFGNDSQMFPLTIKQLRQMVILP